MSDAHVVEAPDDRVRAYYKKEALDFIASKLNIPSTDDDVRRTLRSLSLPAEFLNETRAERRLRLIKHLSETYDNSNRDPTEKRQFLDNMPQKNKECSKGSAELLQSRTLIEKFSLAYRKKSVESKTANETNIVQHPKFSLTSSQSGFKRPISAVSFLNGHTAVIGDWSGSITALSSNDSMQFLSQKQHTAQVVCLSTRANIVLAGRTNGEISLYRYGHSGLEDLQTLKVANSRITASELHPVEPLLVSTSDKCTWSLYDWNAGHNILEQDGHNATINSLSLVEDGSLLLSSGFDIACVWDLRSGAVVGQYHGHVDRITCSSWNHATGKADLEFATGGADNTCLVWDLRNPAEPRSTIYAHNSSLTHLKYSHDGNYLMTSSLDGCLKLWDRQDEFQLNWSTILGTKIMSFDLETQNNESPTLIVGRWDRLVDIYRGLPDSQ